MRTPPVLARRTGAVLAAVAATALVAACGAHSVSSANSSKSSAAVGSGGASASQTTTAASTAVVAGSRSSGPALIVGDQAGTGAQALLQAAGLLHKLPFGLKFADFTSGPPILEAMNAGSVDVAGVGDAPPVFAAAGGAKISIVGARRNNPASAALLVPKGSSISSIKDLKGKKIAVGQGTSADYHLLTVLNQAGLTTHDVQLVYLQPAQALAAFTSHSVDAWDVWSPYVEQAVVEKGAKVLVNGTGYGANFAYEVASKSAVASPTKAKEIRQYLALLNQAYRWANTHSGAWATTWAAATGLPTSVMVKAAKDDTTIPIAVDGQTTSSEQSLADAFAKAGLIPHHYSFAPFTTTAFNTSVG
jgi:sulfonate transport system substrate-binding protein